MDKQPELPLAQVPHRGEAAAAGAAAVLTIGHSTRTLDELIALLRAHGVERLADVRAFPRSRRHPQFHPQFNIDTLPAALGAAGIDYHHLPALGGRRAARPDSANTAWREPGFRGYADYMETAAFAGGLVSLLELASRQRVAIMCAEAQPWRCHRSLIADALVARAVPVEHIMGPGARRPHQPPPFARIAAGRVTYPAVLTA
jgi:uncharacterized protein (DUF488 family)